MRRAVLFAASLLGLFDSIYLWWVYTSPSHPMICLGTGCDVVRASSYAFVRGIPLPAFGTAMYAALALLVFVEPLLPEPFGRQTRLGVAALSGAGFLSSLYLTCVEALVLHAWCAWCVVSALSITLISWLALAEVLRPDGAVDAASARGAARRNFAVFVAALALGLPAFYLLSRGGELPPVQPASAQALAERAVRPDSHVTGSPQSPLTVVEFADFECPYCGRAEEAAREIRRKYGNEIRFAFRHFPQPKIHPLAEKAAEASECAAEQGKFWEAAEKFYANQNDLSIAALGRYASELSLDTNRFQACLASGRMAARVAEDQNDARALGVRATPTFIVGRRMIEGPRDFAQFSQLVEQELAASRGAATTENTALAAPRPQVASSKPASVSPTSQGSDPAKATAPGGTLGGAPDGIFSQFQGSALLCNEEEAAKQQPETIRTPEARKIFEGGAQTLFVDVRAPKEFSTKRIRGAVNVPVEDLAQRWAQIPKDQNVVLYESGKSQGDVCASSRAAGRFLLTHGFRREQVKVYQDGLAAWDKEGLPVER